MPILRIAASVVVGAAILLIIHRISTGGYDHAGEKLLTGAVIGLLGGILDFFRKRRIA